MCLKIVGAENKDRKLGVRGEVSGHGRRQLKVQGPEP